MASLVFCYREPSLWLRGGDSRRISILRSRGWLPMSEFLKLEWIFAVFLRFQNFLAVILIEIFVRDELEKEIG